MCVWVCECVWEWVICVWEWNVFTELSERWWSERRRWCCSVRNQGTGLRRCVCHQRNVSTASALTCWDASAPPHRGHLGGRAGTAYQRPARPPVRQLRMKEKKRVNEGQWSLHLNMWRCVCVYLGLNRPCCSCSSAAHVLERVCLSGWKDLAAHWWRSWCAPPLCPGQPLSQKAPVWTPVSGIYVPQ